MAGSHGRTSGRFEDLYLESWTTMAARPEGERSCASEPYRTIILPSAGAAVQDFLRDRTALLDGKTSIRRELRKSVL